MANNTTTSQFIYTQGGGNTASDPFITVFSNTDPTPYDVNYPIQKRWVNLQGPKEWMLISFNNTSGQTLANWYLLSGGNTSVAEFLVPNGTSPVEPNNDGQITLTSSDSSVVITGGTSSIDFVVDPDVLPVVQGLIPDAFTPPGTSPVVPSSGNITLHGGSTFATGTQANPIRTNSLSANHMDFQIQLAGSNSSTSTPNNFGVSQFDSNGFDVNSGFVKLPLNQDGELLIGSTASPNTKTGFITSNDGSVIITNGSGTIDLSAPGAGGTGPAFSAFLTNLQSNVTGDGTLYKIPLDDTYYDVGNNFNTGTNEYVVPDSGPWSISITYAITGVTPSHNEADFFLQINSGNIIPFTVNPSQVTSATDVLRLSGSVNIDLTTGDTLSLYINIHGGAKVIDVTNGDAGNILSGFLIGAAVSPSGGTVTSFSFTNANGFSGSVNNPTTTPDLTLTTTVTSGQVLYSSSSAIAGEADFTYNDGTNTLSVGTSTSSSNGNIDLGGSTTGLGSISSGNAFRVLTNSVERLRIDNSGAWLLASDPGTSTYVLTSNGAGTPPTWQASGGGGGGITTIDGDSGSATGSTVTFDANTNCGATVFFTAGSSTVTLSVTSGVENTCIGQNSGNLTLSGSSNTFLGTSTGLSLTSGNSNSGLGASCLNSLEDGNNNCALGLSALDALVSGSNNIVLGAGAGSNYTTSESSNILISNQGIISESNVIRIGSEGSDPGQQNTCFIAGIANTTTTVMDSKIVTVDVSTGQLGCTDSPTFAGLVTMQAGQIAAVTTPGGYPYAVLTTDYTIAASSASANTVTLPSTPESGRIYIVKDATGTATSNNITVDGNGNNIDGASTYVINTNYGSVILQFNGTIWMVL